MKTSTILSTLLICLLLLTSYSQQLSKKANPYCSSQFPKIDNYSLTTYSKDQYKKLKDSNQVAKYFKTQDKSSFESYYVMIAIPWIILGSLMIILFLFLSFYWLVKKKPFYVKRKLRKKPITKCEILYPIITIIVFSGLNVGVGFNGLFQAQQGSEWIPHSKCALSQITHNILEYDQFIGINNINSIIETILNNYSKDSLLVEQQKMKNLDWVQTQGETIRTDNINIYTTHKDVQVYTPNPANAGSKQSPNTLKFSGPVSNSDALTYRIEQNVYNPIRYVGELITNMDKSAVQIKNNTNSIQTRFTVAKTINLQYLQQTQELDNYIKNDLFNKVDSQNNLLIKGSQGILIVVLMISIYNIISLVTFMACRFKQIRILLHSMWIVSFIICIFCYFIVGGLWSLSDGVYEYCIAFSDFTRNQESMAKYPNYMNQNFKDKSSICLWKNSHKFQDSLNISKELQYLSELTFNYQNLKDSNYSTLNQTQDTILSAEIKQVNDSINGMKVRLNVDYPYTDDNNPLMALYNLNLYTNQLTGSIQLQNGCSISKDSYVFNLNECPYGYQIFNNATNVASFNYGSQTCIEIKQMTLANFQNRNADILSRCSAIYTQMINYYQSIQTFDKSHREAQRQLKLSVNALQTKVVNYVAEIKTQSDQYMSISSQINNFINSTNQLSALMGCSQLGKDIQNYIDVLCAGLGPKIYQCTTMLAVGTIALMFNSILAYLLAIKYDLYKPIRLNENKNIYLRRNSKQIKQQIYKDDQQDNNEEKELESNEVKDQTVEFQQEIVFEQDIKQS